MPAMEKVTEYGSGFSSYQIGGQGARTITDPDCESVIEAAFSGLPLRG